MHLSSSLWLGIMSTSKNSHLSAHLNIRTQPPRGWGGGYFSYCLGAGVPLGSRKPYPFNTRVNFANVTLYRSKNALLFLISIFYYNFCPRSDPVKRDPILDQWLKNHALSSGTYPCSQYMRVPPPPNTAK